MTDTSPSNSAYDSPTTPLNFKEVLVFLRCHRLFILSIAIIGGLIGFAYGMMTIPQFSSSSSVLIQPQRGESAQVAEVTGAGLELSSGMLEAETRLILSPEFLRTLINDLELRDHPEYKDLEEEYADDGSFFDSAFLHDVFFDKVYGSVASAWSSSTEVQEDSLAFDSLEADEANSYEEDWVLLEVMDRLSTEQQSDAFLISLVYSSSDPFLSAKIVNYAADLYVKTKLDEKLGSIKDASSLMNKRVKGLRRLVLEAESEVERFKQNNSLLSTSDGSLLVDEELVAVKGNLSNAQAEYEVQTARYQYLQSARDTDKEIESLADEATAQRILSLKNELASLSRARAENVINLGPKHPTMIALNAEIQEIHDKLDTERNLLIKVQFTNVQLAQKRTESLTLELNRLRQASADDRALQIQVRDLEREAAVKRELYEALLARLERTDQERDAIQADARIVSTALVPQDASTPPPIGFGLVGFVGSLSLATFLALLRERLRVGFAQVHETERLLGHRVLSTIPLTKKGDSTPVWKAIAKNPASLFAESFAKVYMGATFNLDQREEALVILVTSAVPAEGKTTLSTCLATYVAKMNPHRRVLLVDLDFRRPAIVREFGDVTLGLAEYLSSDQKLSLDDVIKNTELDNLDLLPIRASTQESAALIGSDAMHLLLPIAKPLYDLIIFDCPPILAVSEAKIAVKWADICLFAVKWLSTSKEAVKQALDELNEINAPVAGVVFTMANIKKYNKYNYLEGGKYHKNYLKYYGSK